MFLQQPKQSRPQRYSISLPLEIPKNGGFILSIAPLYTCFWSSSVVPPTTLQGKSAYTPSRTAPDLFLFLPALHKQLLRANETRIRPKKKDRPAEEKRHSSAGRKIFVRTQGNFCAHKKIFSCARKFISFRKEISPSAEGGLSPLHNKRLGRRHKNYLTPACL